MIGSTAWQRNEPGTVRVDRLRLTHTFTARSFASLIGHYVSRRRDPTLYASPVVPRDGTFTCVLEQL